jgi:hypothetical protein
LNAGADSNYLSNQQPQYAQSMVNLGSKRATGNQSSASTEKFKNHPTPGQLVGVHSAMQQMNVGSLTKSSKVIPKKEWRDQNFNTASTSQLKSSVAKMATIAGVGNPTIASLQTGYSQISKSTQGLLAGQNMQSYNSSQGVGKMKFEKTANLATIASLTNQKNANQLSATMIPQQAQNANYDTNGRYKKKSGMGATGVMGQVVGAAYSNASASTKKFSAKQNSHARMLEKHDFARGSGQLHASGKASFQTLAPAPRDLRGSTQGKKSLGTLAKLSGHSSRNQSTGLKAYHTVTNNYLPKDK